MNVRLISSTNETIMYEFKDTICNITNIVLGTRVSFKSNYKEFFTSIIIDYHIDNDLITLNTPYETYVFKILDN